jgi:hypothetical protein
MSVFRFRRGRAVAWSPYLLGNDLLAYWDARYGITESGGLVSSWVDRKHGYDAVQATEASKPSWDGEWVTADSNDDDQLTLAALPSGIPSGATPSWDWFAVDMLDAASSQTVGGWGGASSITGRRITTTSSGRFQSAVGNGSSTVGATNPSTSTVLGRHVLCAKVSATETEMVVDGMGMTPVAVVPSTGTSRLRFFSSPYNTANLFANARIAARLITRPLSAGREAILTRWLTAVVQS